MAHLYRAEVTRSAHSGSGEFQVNQQEDCTNCGNFVPDYMVQPEQHFTDLFRQEDIPINLHIHWNHGGDRLQITCLADVTIPR